VQIYIIFDYQLTLRKIFLNPDQYPALMMSAEFFFS